MGKLKQTLTKSYLVHFPSRLYLIARLDCGLDHWTGLLDWITELTLTFELNLCVPHDFNLISCAEFGHMFDI